MRLLIDPGHGGTDKGAEGNGLVEADLVLEIALALREALSGLAWKVTVEITREEADVLAGKRTLAERGQIERRFGADLVLSIHANANPAPATSGLMAFCWPGSDVGREVATAIQRSAPAALWRTDVPYSASKEQWPRVRNVLASYRAPAVLVEAGFLTNPEDARALMSTNVRREIVATLLAGVARGISVIDTTTRREAS